MEPRRKAVLLGRSNISFEKRQREREKKKKREAKAQARAERKAAKEARKDLPEPVITLDEYGNVVETMPEGYVPSDESADEGGSESSSSDESPTPPAE
jgi:hypothetical protein